MGERRVSAPRTSRRSVIGALALIPAIPLSGTAVAMDRDSRGDDAMNMHSTISSALTRAAWEKAQERHERAIAASDKHDAEVYTPAYRELERRAPRPDLTLRVPLTDGTTHTEHLIPSFLDSYCEESRFGALAMPLRDAWNVYLANKKQADQELGWSAIQKRQNILDDRIGHARQALLKMPAPDLAALRWKLEHTIEPDETGDTVHWHDEVRLVIVADYQRLLPADDIIRYPSDRVAPAADLSSAA